MIVPMVQTLIYQEYILSCHSCNFWSMDSEIAFN